MIHKNSNPIRLFLNKIVQACLFVLVIQAILISSGAFTASAADSLPPETTSCLNGRTCPADQCCYTCKADGTVDKVVNNCNKNFELEPVLGQVGPYYACKCVPKTGNNQQDPPSDNTAPESLQNLFRILNTIILPVGIILGLFLIMIAGYKIMSSQGDPSKLTAGKDQLTGAIMGLIFILGAMSILRVIIRALLSGYGDNTPF